MIEYPLGKFDVHMVVRSFNAIDGAPTFPEWVMRKPALANAGRPNPIVRRKRTINRIMLKGVLVLGSDRRNRTVGEAIGVWGDIYGELRPPDCMGSRVAQVDMKRARKREFHMFECIGFCFPKWKESVQFGLHRWVDIDLVPINH